MMNLNTLSVCRLQWLGVLVAGTLLGLGYAGAQIIAVWIGWTLFLLSMPWTKVSFGRALLMAWCFQLIPAWINSAWLGASSSAYGGLSSILSWLVVVAFSAIALLQIPLGVAANLLLRKYLQLSRGLLMVSTVFIIWALETALPSFMPSNWGYAISSHYPVVQLADWIGMSGLSFLVYLLAAWAAVILGSSHAVDSWAKRVVRLWQPLLACVLLNVVGWLHGRSVIERTATEAQELLLVQPYDALHLGEELTPTRPKRVVESINRLIRTDLEAYLATPDLIILPELVYPMEVRTSPLHLLHGEPLLETLTEFRAPLLMGAYVEGERTESVVDGHIGYTAYNSALLLSSAGELVGTYDKHLLFPFVEQYPFVNRFTDWLFRLLPERRMIAGDFGYPLDLDGLNLGVSICYESIYPEHIAQQARDGANLLVNLSNDLWYAESLGGEHHSRMTMARALETRLPVVRVSKSGVTGVVGLDGQVLKEFPVKQDWAERVSVPVPLEWRLTFYVQHPNLLLIIVASIWISLMLRAFLQRKETV